MNGEKEHEVLFQDVRCVKCGDLVPDEPRYRMVEKISFNATLEYYCPGCKLDKLLKEMPG